ncbi:septal ring lytic transglycosylase RlpA family protein [Novosphingobium album (ex Liu et al. 2023)]|uniref:SPOR domain-containing protein n=1 Tax=Novosphingobium album (ex Liu et al. 2023) TaxID=3031130 RepID=A0ABT5WPC4_9SPHN|nr:SPOR domain-containing protein [Novosphingobium album (ex Liu et al. 2023)]MDE8651905.1 SPOR domain-containing protein [Novosphingobium album (ex Liu et al. 2023)]
MRLSVNHALPLAALILLGGSASGILARPAPAPALPVTGPAADYPMVIGDPFTIGAITYTPSDQLNYDAVGMAAIGDAASAGVTGAHKTLPLPSYVEVTALDSGRTILVRLERRGPMANDLLIELSPAAAAQLGLAPGASAAVRVRRVNPPEIERAALRQGREAPERMATPDALLKVLRRKLAEQSPLGPPASIPPAMPTTAPATATPAKTPAARPSPAPAPTGTPKPAPKPAAPKPASKPETPLAPRPAAPAVKAGAYVVQVAAFSARDHADKAARQLGGVVSKPGKFWLVRLGPFASSGEAGPALEKAKAAGYRDARIQRAD